MTTRVASRFSRHAHPSRGLGHVLEAFQTCQVCQRTQWTALWRAKRSELLVLADFESSQIGLKLGTSRRTLKRNEPSQISSPNGPELSERNGIYWRHQNTIFFDCLARALCSANDSNSFDANNYFQHVDLRLQYVLKKMKVSEIRDTVFPSYFLRHKMLPNTWNLY